MVICIRSKISISNIEREIALSHHIFDLVPDSEFPSISTSEQTTVDIKRIFEFSDRQKRNIISRYATQKYHFIGCVMDFTDTSQSNMTIKAHRISFGEHASINSSSLAHAIHSSNEHSIDFPSFHTLLLLIIISYCSTWQCHYALHLCVVCTTVYHTNICLPLVIRYPNGSHFDSNRKSHRLR